MMSLPMFFRVSSLALGQSYVCPHDAWDVLYILMCLPCRGL